MLVLVRLILLLDKGPEGARARRGGVSAGEQGQGREYCR